VPGIQWQTGKLVFCGDEHQDQMPAEENNLNNEKIIGLMQSYD
jgi:hypothetical protein